MTRRNRAVFRRLMATTSLVALSLSVMPVALDPAFGGAAMSYAESGSSCFVAGTAVLMADGSERPIESLRPGDLVRGAGGRVNRVVGVERPCLGARRLYAFNGGRPFVTAEHPFLTMAGWKAIDPAATARENAALKVTALKIGDLLTRAWPAAPHAGSGNLAADVAVEFSLAVLMHIEAADGDAAMTVYNLLLDGDHSYVADGFVVHNKGGDDGGGEGGGGEGGGESGDDGGGDDDGGESGESGDDDSGESGEGSELGSGGDDVIFSGDPGAADHDLSPDEEADLIGRGWR